MTFEQKLISAVQTALSTLQAQAPHDTGNLKYNAIKLESLGPGKWRIWVDEKIAPYMVFTNEVWIKPRGKYKQNVPYNPNQGWFDRAAQVIINILATKLGGEIGGLQEVTSNG